MSTVEIKLTIDDSVTPFLKRLEKALTDRTDLHAYIAPVIEDVTRQYLLNAAPARHKTAFRLGAKPTGHLSDAAAAMESGHDSGAAWIKFPASTGLGRAFHPFVLTTPTASGKKWLTIPVHRRAYGKRAGEFKELEFVQFNAETAGLFFRSAGEGKQELMYLLRKKVTIPQDRRLLPSDVQWASAAELGARNYIKDLEVTA